MKRTDWLGSIGVHAVLIAVLVFHFKTPLPSLKSIPFQVEFHHLFSKKTPSSHGGGAGRSMKRLDLRPSFVQGGSFFSAPAHDAPSVRQPSRPGDEFLFVEGKVVQVFDLLAERVNQHLDYPTMLVENGIQGAASLELYFDHDGNVDELRSRCAGDNKIVRGLLVKATREGLQSWFPNEAGRLHKDQFRDQHFHADLIVSSFERDASEVSKASEGSYNFLRRRYVNKTCMVPGAIDLMCLGEKVAGAIKGTGTTYRMRFEALKESTEHFDDLGLDGINAIIREVQGA